MNSPFLIYLPHFCVTQIDKIDELCAAEEQKSRDDQASVGGRSRRLI